MEMSARLLKSFAKAVNNQNGGKSASTVYGTLHKDGETISVKIDGAEERTPAYTTVNGQTGDRVICEIRNHAVYVTGNLSDPSATNGEVGMVAKKVNQIEANTVTTEYLEATYATIENLTAVSAKIDKITATDITVEYLEGHYAQIDYANVDVASIRQGFLQSLMVSQGIVADRIVGSEVTATNVLTGVNVYADDITAGTLSVDRLVFRGNEQSIVYKLNQISGALQEESVDTINGEVITPRTITADRIVAKAITATEIDVENLVSTGLIEANRLTSKNIEVDDLFAMDITAAGSIKSKNYAYTSGIYSTAGVKMSMATGQIISRQFAIDISGNTYFAGNLSAPSGNIGGFTIGTKALYNGTNSMTSTAVGVYLGTDGFRQYKSANVYTQIKDGKLTCIGADIKGNLYLDNALMMWHEADESTSGARYETALSWVKSSDIYKLNLGGNTVMAHYMEIQQDLHVYGSANVLGNLSAKTATISSIAEIKGTLVLSKTKDLSGTANNSPALIIGGVATSGHIEIDNNEIQGKANGTTPNQVTINGNGGNVNIGDSANNYETTIRNNLNLGKTLYANNIIADNITMSNAKWLNSYVYVANSSGALIPYTTHLIGINSSFNVHMGDYGGANVSPVYLHAKGKQYNFTNAAFCPNNTNDVPLGLPSKLWKTVYAKTGTINTSDRTKKHDIKDLTEVYEKLFLKLQPKSFIFNDGDRVHIGAISQDVEDAMQELGMSAEDFAGFCKDIRYDYQEYNDDGTPIEKSRYIVTDDDGNPVYDYALRYQDFIFLTIHMVQILWGKMEMMENEIVQMKKAFT